MTNGHVLLKRWMGSDVLRTQEWLAERLSEKLKRKVSQATISKWFVLDQTPGLDFVEALREIAGIATAEWLQLAVPAAADQERTLRSGAGG